MSQPIQHFETANMIQAIQNDLKSLERKYSLDVADYYYLTLQPVNLYFKNNPPKTLQRDIIATLDRYFQQNKY